jgi:putative DNA primase/helicase
LTDVDRALHEIDEATRKKDDAEKFTELIMQNHNFITLSETDEILHYQGGVYVSNGEAIIKAELEKLKPNASNHLCSEVLGHIQRRTYRSRDEFDANPYILNLKNGLLDMKTTKIREHDSKYLSRIQLPVQFKHDAKCPRIQRFLLQVQPDHDARTAVLEHAAYTLLPTCFLQKAFMYLGDGRNGKSTWLQTLMALLGKKNVANESVFDLENKRFAASNLDAKLANIYPDISANEITHTGRLKSLVTGDPISVEKKHKAAFQLANRAKFFFSANQLPETQDSSDAWFRRWIITEWMQRFDGKTDDRELVEKLTTESELSGLLDVLVPYAAKIMRKRKLSYEPTIEQMRQEWTAKADLLKAFVDETLEPKPSEDRWVPKADLYSKYVKWCQKHKFAPKSTRSFNEALPMKATVREDVIKPGGRGGKSIKVWRPLAFLAKSQEPPGSTGSTSSDDPLPTAGNLDNNSGGSDKPSKLVERVEHPAPEPKDSRDRVIAKLKSIGAFSLDYALEQIRKIINDSSKAELYLKQFKQDGLLLQDPEGYWRIR